MWTNIMCPKCGEKFEINLNEADETVVCRFCMEHFVIPYHLHEQLVESETETCLVSGKEPLNSIDSSFWIS
jgi:hypothetical protein